MIDYDRKCELTNYWYSELVNYASLWYIIYKLGFTIIIGLRDKQGVVVELGLES